MPFNEIYGELAGNDYYRFIVDRIGSAEQSHSYLSPRYSDLSAWRAETRAFLQELLSYAPPEVPFNASVTEEIDFGTYIRKKVYFDSAPGSRVPAYLLLPKGVDGPVPGMVVLHDHGAMFYWGKEKSVAHKDVNPYLEEYVAGYYEGLPVASGYAERGYAVLVIDSLFFGERSFVGKYRRQGRLTELEPGTREYVDEYNNRAVEVESALVRSIYYAGHTFMGIRTWDDRASVGFLAAQPGVDPERIGCVGLSMGGHRAAWLGAMDDRIRCSAVVGWMAELGGMNRHRLPNIPWMWNVPGLHGRLDHPDVASLSAPKPLLVLHGLRDWLFPYETGTRANGTIAQIYEKAGAPDQFKACYYDVPHEFNREMQETAFAWMDRHLKHG